MTLYLTRVRTRYVSHNIYLGRSAILPIPRRHFHNAPPVNAVNHNEAHGEEKRPNSDPKINDLGKAIEDDFATIRDRYGLPFL
jgi:hypothetical protein